MAGQSMQRARFRGIAWGSAALVAAVAAVVALVATPGDDRPESLRASSASLSIPVVSAADDASETISTGLVELQRPDLELGEDAEGNIIGLRFEDVAVPPGAVITSAYVQFASARYTDRPTDLLIVGEAVDDASSFARLAGNLSARATTQASATWEPGVWNGVGEIGGAQRTADLSAVVGEIVARPGWESGNALALLITGTGRRAAESFDGPLGLPPTLHVELTEPSAENRVPVVRAGDDRTVELGDTVHLDGSVSDDGDVTLSWSTRSGPGAAVIAEPTAASTTATFPEAGRYVLGLVADDGAISREDTVTITVVDSDALAPPVRFAVIGDFGEPGPGAANVAALVRSAEPEFVVTVGDNAYVPDIDDAVGSYYADYIGNYTGRFGAGAPENRFFPAIGNHEYTDLAGGIDDYLDYFTLPGDGIESTNTSGNERYYDFVRGPVHFFVLNSNTSEPDGRDSRSVQAQWLERQVMASTAPWQVVVMHHAPYSSDRGGTETAVMRWPFASWGVDVVLAGHAHVYERLEADGITYFVNGIGGEGASGLTVEPLPENRARYNGGFGAMIVDACAARMEFELLTLNEGLVDSYAIGATDCSGSTPIDQAPYAAAGPDVTVTFGDAVTLSGVVSDDGQVSARWSQLDGPADADFASPTLAETAVTFSAPGFYSLQLEASDGAQVAVDTVDVIVTSATYGAVEAMAEASTDDAEQRLSSGSVQVESTDLGLGIGSQPQLVGIRFGSVAVPAGAVIERAYIRFEVDEITRDPATLEIVGQRALRAAPFTSTPFDISSRATTEATVRWVPPPWLAVRAAGIDQRTPDLSAVVQEIVDQDGWASGGSMVFVVSGDGNRTAESADGSPGGAPLLHVEYSLE